MPTTAPAKPAEAVRRSNRPLYMVFVCTLLAAGAQVLLKFGALHPMPKLTPGDAATWAPFAMGLLGNAPLVAGYTLHGGNAGLLILALRDGELSLLYPVYALSYVWVNLLSMYYFGEMMNVWKAAGIAFVIAGVAMLGRASGRR